MIKYVKPVIVLSLITAIVSALLIVTYNLTYVDTSGIITDELMEKCVHLMGEGDYSIVTDWKAEGYLIEKPEDVEKLIKKADGSVAFQVVTSGYNKNGLDLLIAMNNDGTIKGVSVVSITETPGLGTKVNDAAFLDRFVGIGNNVSIVKNSPANEYEIEAAAGATYSSKGVAAAINIVVDTYKEMGAVK